MLNVCFEKTVGSFNLNSSFSANIGALGILGSSGCGKSMTLKCIAGLLNPDKGCIKLKDTILFSSELKINVPPRKRNIGYVFQNYALFPHMTVSQNIAYGIRYLDKQTQKQNVADMVSRMHLSGLESQYPSQLSWGQQQRAALGRTLITDPFLLMLDEPFSALDSHIRHLLEKELINIIRHNFKGIVLLVTHNIEEAYRICDNIMVIDRGQNIQMDAKDQIIRAPANATAAKITGCKNILNVYVLEETAEYYVLQSKKLIFRAAKSSIAASGNMLAGIRAHYLSLSSLGATRKDTFVCDVVEKIEGVFSTTIVVSCGGCELRIEVEKAVAPHIAECACEQMMLHIPPEHVFLMECANQDNI